MTTALFLESLHLIEFALLYLLIVLALKVHHRFTRTTNLLAAVFSMFYGLVDEIHQWYVPERSFTMTDLLKDGIGVFTAFLIVHYLHFYRHRKKVQDEVRHKKITGSR
ncbi:VanZ family protein [Halobacillus litoralis]|uniref:VanZ family protein n=1 Tax=Halobacillus litoralis TaxID=45668 RepID=UPI001CFF3876|nr:VanZ family protein [Halobacillus litoralis]